MNIPDNMDELLGKDEAREILDNVAADDVKELFVIWTTGDDEDDSIFYAANGLRQSRVNWLLDRVKCAVLDERA